MSMRRRGGCCVREDVLFGEMGKKMAASRLKKVFIMTQQTWGIDKVKKQNS